jgi:hypothetical protein
MISAYIPKTDKRANPSFSIQVTRLLIPLASHDSRKTAGRIPGVGAAGVDEDEISGIYFGIDEF